MSSSLLLSLIALEALVPAAVAPVMRGDALAASRDGIYWALLAVAIAGPALWIWTQLGSAWRTGLAPALWLSIAVSLVLFAIVSALSRVAWRLSPLLLGYLFLLGVLATIWQHAPERPLSAHPPAAWLQAHILVAISAYGLLTLPSVAEGERLQIRLLMASEAVLAVALITGMTIEWLERRRLLVLDHKTVLSIATFAVIALLLWLHHRGGLSFRRGARYLLLAYLLLTLAYPGVKFVTDVLI